MATFAPQIPDTGIPDMTGNSRGTGPDQTFEALFKGLSETATNVVGIKDAENQSAIEADAQTMFESVNNEFGVQAPAGVTDGLDKMQALQNALEQGKLSEVNYYGRLATLSKQLRTKYPGYESIVDAKIQAVTGTRPANAYRDAIFQELANNAESASNTEKFQRQYIKENEAEIGLIYGDDFFQNPSKYDFEEVQSKVARMKGDKYRIDAETSELGLMAKRGEYNEKRAAKAIDSEYTLLTQTALNRAIGANQASFQSTLDTFVAKGAPTGPELDQFISSISQVENDLRAQLTLVGRQKYVSNGLVSAEQMNKSVEAALYPITEAKKAILGGDFKLAAKYATINKSISDQAANDLLADPTIRAGAGLTTLNNTLGEEFFGQNAAKINDIAMEIVGRTMSGQSNDIVRKTVEHGDSKLTKETIKTSFKAIVNPNLQGEEFHNVVDQYFGPSAIDFMSPKVVASEDLLTVYTQFLRPEVTQAIFSKGSEEDKQNYVNWAMSKAAAIPEFRNAAGDVNFMMGAAKSGYGVPGYAKSLIFDEKNLRLGIVNDTGEYFQDKTVNAFNKVISVLKPIVDAQGADGVETVKQFVKNLNVQVDSPFWDEVDKAIQGSGETGDLPGKAGQDSLDNQNLVGLGDLASVDFENEREQYDVLDETDTEPHKPSGGGLADLVPSRARGYDPDLKGLRPELRSGLIDLQNAWGRELPIVSGYRDPVRNKKAGGAKHSQHMHGNAVDIDVRGLSREEIVDLIRLARSKGFGGVGVYGERSLHLDKGSVRAWGPNYRNNSLPGWARAALG